MAIDQLKERLKFEKNKSNKEKLSNNSSKILTVKEKVIEEIKKIYDPEIPVNIYELGLIYDIIIDEVNNVKIDMTLTSPNCPVAESLPNEVKNSIKEIKEIKDVDLNLVWDPPWNKDMMSEAAKLELNI
tara:strand:- start:141 stop:527 length:387 start_codon:yes stop_codon:yes gene_type:complete